MIKRLIFAFALLLSATSMAMAQTAIPIVLHETTHGQVLYLPSEAEPGAFVDFSARGDAGYEAGEINVYSVVVDGSSVTQTPLDVEEVNPRQYGFHMPAEGVECTRVEVEVSFKKIRYNVLINDTIENGRVELVGENGVPFDETVLLKVTPDPQYLFNSISAKTEQYGQNVPLRLVQTEGDVKYFEFTMPTTNVLVNASFKPVPRYAINVYEGEYGQVTSNVATALVGDTVTLSLTHDPGCLLTELKVLAGYPITSGSGGAQAPKLAGEMWYQQGEIELTKIDDKTYQFVLPEAFDDVLTPNYQDDTEFRVMSTFEWVSPVAIWCAGSKTLYFAYDEDPTEKLVPGSTWNREEITSVWYGKAITNVGWSTPAWDSNSGVRTGVRKVVFDESFADVRPKSCYSWFYSMLNLATIEGIENLNTSEVTNMNGMFLGTALTTIDVNTFDMTNVTNTYGMFRACENLTTIYCDNTWNVNTSESMFLACSVLVGAVAYDSSKTDGSMANPVTGYFTSSHPITLVSSGDGEVTVPERAFPNHTVTITADPAPFCTIGSVTVTGDNSGNNVEVTAADGNYTFVMPGEPVTVNVVFNVPDTATAVIWCEDVKTLYFISKPYEEVAGNTYDGHAITATWGGKDVTNNGWGVPAWDADAAVKQTVEKVVFDESFAAVRPKSCYAWFYDMENLATIEGIENLNTSEVTNMNTMFYGVGLTTIDVNTFDVSKVTNATGMFRSCSNLTTIYCNNTWNIPTSGSMFLSDFVLVGIVPYTTDAVGGDMANPHYGYFTGKWDIIIPEVEGASVTCDHEAAYTGETVTFTIQVGSGFNISLSAHATIYTGDIMVPLIQDEFDFYTYTFTMPAGPVTLDLVVTSLYNNGTLEQVLAGEDINRINEDLYIGQTFADDCMVYAADADGNWIALHMRDDVVASILEDGNNVIKAYTLVGEAAHLDTNPEFEVESVPDIVAGDAAEPVSINMSEVFSNIKGNTLVKIDAYYKGNRFSAYQSDNEGQSLAINETYMPTDNLVNKQRYTVSGVLRLLAPWDAETGNGAPRRIGSSSPDYFQNMEILPYKVDIVTGVSEIATVGEVAGVKYVSVTGMVSDQPFEGVNIVVTRHADGTTTTSKVVF